MFRKCNENDYSVLMDYLKKEQILNTFIISDLDNYGFDKEYQVTYMDTDEKGACTAVALIFHNNLIISGSSETMDYSFLATLLTEKINNVMGQGELVEAFNSYLAEVECSQITCNSKSHTKPDGSLSNNEVSSTRNYIEKTMYTLDKGLKLQACDGVQLATLEDVDAIHDFIMRIPEISFLYKEKSMIINRMETGEGVHLFIKEKGEIVAHTNSAAGTDISSMMGGVAVAPEFRNQGYGKRVVSAVANYVLNQKKVACLFSKSEEENNLFTELGFVAYKKWGTLSM